MRDTFKEQTMATRVLSGQNALAITAWRRGEGVHHGEQ